MLRQSTQKNVKKRVEQKNYHHCLIKKNHIINWDILHTFISRNLMYEVLHKLALDSLAEFVNQRNSLEHVLRGPVRDDRDDCHVFW